jgi:hypothetical protein
MRYETIVVGSPFEELPPATKDLMTWKQEQSAADFVLGYRNQTHDEQTDPLAAPYGRCPFVFAARWARAMENRLGDVVPTTGAEIAEIADDTFKEVDATPNMDITLNQYGYAVMILHRVWVHGDALREWHNASYGVPATEKRVVRPNVFRVEC